MSYGIIEPEAFTSMMALLRITSAEEAEGKFEDTPLQNAFEVEVLSYEEQDEDAANTGPNPGTQLSTTQTTPSPYSPLPCGNAPVERRRHCLPPLQ
jgi:hypothetical protein